MIHVTCPKCSKAYNLGDDKAGRTFRCLQCQGKVSVPDPALANDPFAPDWKDEIPEAAPYGESDIPEAVPIARSRGSSRTRSSGGGSGVWIGLIAGVVLFAITAGVIFVILRDRNPRPAGVPVVADPESRGEADSTTDGSTPSGATQFVAGDYLPVDSPVVIAMQGQTISRDRVFHAMFGRDHADNTFAAMTLDHLGFHPDEFIRILVALQPDAEFTASGTRWMTAIDLRDSIDWGARQHPQFTRRTVGTQTIHDLSGLFQRDYAAWQPHGKVLIFGDVALVEQSIAHGAEQGENVLLDRLADDAVYCVSADLVACDWLRNLTTGWGINPAEALDCRHVTFSHSFAFSGETSQWEWRCEVDLFTDRAPTEQELRSLLDRALDDLNMEPFHVSVQPGQGISRILIINREFPRFILEYLAHHLELMKKSAYHLAGRPFPSPLTGVVLNEPGRTNSGTPRQPPPRTTPSASPAVVVDAVRPPPLAVDLERMQLAAAGGELATFIESFYPRDVADSLANEIERQDEADWLSELPDNGDADALCRALLHATPEFSSDGTTATFHIALDLDIPESPSADRLRGYGSNLEAAIQSAIDTLDSGVVNGLVSSMFPASQAVRLLDDEAAMEELNTRVRVYPAMLETMQAELRECLEVGLTQGETIAEAILTEGRRTPRVVRFQLVNGHWRFFDPGPPPAADADAEFETITLVHDGQVWRLGELPSAWEK